MLNQTSTIHLGTDFHQCFGTQFTILVSGRQTYQTSIHSLIGYGQGYFDFGLTRKVSEERNLNFSAWNL